MRPLEIALCLATAPLLAWSLSGRAMPASAARVWAALGLLVLALQVTVEGPRWHLGPAYLLAIYLFVVCSWARAPALGLGRTAGACGMGLLATAALLGTVLPVFRLPDPTGAHSVGTVTLHLVDLSRQEPHCAPPGHRELMIQVWYPAQTSGPGVAYCAPAETSLKKQQLTLVRTHAVRGAAVASGRRQYPVVICAPSWTGRKNQNTVQAEEMASHGFIVVGVDHPYGTELTRFPDGRVVRTTLGAPLDYSTDEALATSVRSAEAELRVR